MGKSSSLSAIIGGAEAFARKALVNHATCDQLSLANAVRELTQLNLQYLSLPTVQSRLLELTGESDSLSYEARRIAADSLFSLFTIGFNDPTRWPLLLATRSPNPAQPSGIAQHPSAEAEFVVSVVFFAWHLVRTDPAAAKMLLDVHDDVAAALIDVSVSRLLGTAVASLCWLRPRWEENRHFWPSLLKCARNREIGGLRAAKLLGRQLLAAESLEFSPDKGTRDRRIRQAQAPNRL